MLGKDAIQRRDEAGAVMKALGEKLLRDERAIARDRQASHRCGCFEGDDEHEA